MEIVMRMSRVGAAAATLLLTLPGVAVAQGGAGTTPLFSVNLGTTVWTAVVFLALLAILRRFAWGPILGAVEAREQGIQAAIDEAAARHAEAERMLAEHREQLADARRQANELVAEGRAAAQGGPTDNEEKAREEAHALIRPAQIRTE